MFSLILALLTAKANFDKNCDFFVVILCFPTTDFFLAGWLLEENLPIVMLNEENKKCFVLFLAHFNKKSRESLKWK